MPYLYKGWTSSVLWSKMHNQGVTTWHCQILNLHGSVGGVGRGAVGSQTHFPCLQY